MRITISKQMIIVCVLLMLPIGIFSDFTGNKLLFFYISGLFTLIFIPCLGCTQQISKKKLYFFFLIVIMLLYNVVLCGKIAYLLIQWMAVFSIAYFLEKQYGDVFLEKILNGIWWMSIPANIYALLEISFGNLLEGYAIRSYGTERIHSFFLHPIIFAHFLLISFLINIYVCKNKTLKIFYSLLIVLCLLMTQTRSAWIVQILILLILGIRNGKKFSKKKRVSTQILLIVVLIFSLTIYFAVNGMLRTLVEMIVKRWNGLVGSFSLNYRISTIVTVLESRFSSLNIVHWLLGQGISSSQNVLSNSGIYLQTIENNVIDNQWIAVFYDFGIVGIVMLLSAYLKSLKYVFISQNHVLPLVLICLTNLTMGFFYDSFGWSTSMILTFLFGGVLAARMSN